VEGAKGGEMRYWPDGYLPIFPDIFKWASGPDYPRNNFYKGFTGKSKTMKKNKRKK
jgi:hypothetical protein